MYRQYQVNHCLVSFQFEMEHIPKFIHQIWIGNDPLPERFKQGQYGWKELYPEYKYILWNNNRVESEFNDIVHFKYLIQKVDFIKYLIMRKYGGVYSDLDLSPKKRFDELITVESDCYVAPSQLNEIFLTNCILIGKPNVKIWSRLIEQCIKRNREFMLTKHIDVTRTTGSWMLTSMKDKSMCVLSKQFVPNILNGQKETEYFIMLDGSTWNGSDTNLFVSIYKNMSIIFLSFILIILILIYKRLLCDIDEVVLPDYLH